MRGKPWLHRIGCILLAAVIVTVACYLFVRTKVEGKDSYDGALVYKNLDYQADLQENGDLRITQDVTIRLPERKGDEVWKSLYQKYTLKGTNLTHIKDVTITDITDNDNPKQYAKGEYAVPYDYTKSEWAFKQSGHWYLVDTTNGNYPERTPEPLSTTPLRVDSRDERTVQLGWHIRPTSSGTMRFRIGFTFQDVATTYNDATKLMWEPISADNQTPVEHVTGVFRFPKGFKAQQGKNAWAWLHCERPSTLTWHDEDSDTPYLTFEATGLYKNYLDLLVMFSPPDEHVARKATGDTIQSTISREESDRAKSEDAARKFQRARSMANVAVGVATVMTLIISGIVCFMAVSRKRKSNAAVAELYNADVKGLSRYSISEITNVTSKYLLEERDITSTVLQASMMMLMNAGFISVVHGDISWYSGYPARQLTPTFLKLIANSHRDEKTNDSVVIMRVPRGSKAMEYLRRMPAPCEEAMELLWTIRECTDEAAGVAVPSIGIQMSDMNAGKLPESYKRRVYDSYTVFRAAVGSSSIMRDLNIGGKPSTGEPHSASVLSKVSGGTIVKTILGVLFVLIVLCVATVVSVWYGTSTFIPLAMLASVLGVSGGLAMYLPCVNADNPEVKEILGFRNYLTGDGLFRDRNTLDITLWGRLLVYATAMYCADTVARELRDSALLDANDANDNRIATVDIMMGSLHGAGMVSSPISMLGSSMRDYCTRCDPNFGKSSSSGSSSSGFSGSSGGSGGGSFGGW